MTLEIISWSISTKVWDRAGITLANPGSAVRLASVARHVTDCATQPGTVVLTCMQTVLTKIRLLHMEQSDLGPCCLLQGLPFFKHSSRPQSRWLQQWKYTYQSIKINFLQERSQSVKMFGPRRAGSKFCQAWYESKLFAKVITRELGKS